jgi:hypothetical protein
MRWQEEGGHEPGRTPDSVVVLGEPEVAVRARGDLDRLAQASRDRELSDGSRRRDAADLPDELREPEVCVGPGHDASREAPRRRERELRQLAAPADASDPAPVLLGKPEALVRPRGNVNRRAPDNRKRDLRHDLASRGARRNPENAGQDEPGKAAKQSPKMATAMTLRHALDSEPRGIRAQPR